MALLLIAGVYQVGGDYRWDMGNPRADVYLGNYFGVERSGDVRFRWTQPVSRLQAPLVGSYNGRVHVRLNGDTFGGPPRQATIRVGTTLTRTVALEPGWHDYELAFSRADLWPGDLQVWLFESELQIPKDQRDPADTRRLGVPVQSITVERADRLVLPPLGMLAGTALVAALLFALAVWFGVPRRAATGITTLLLLGWAAALFVGRLPAVFAAPGLLGTLALGVALAVLLCPLLGWLFRRGGIAVRPVEWQVLAGLFVLGFVFKASGLLDPMFTTLDHYARLHRLMEMGDDPVYFLANFLNSDKGQTYAGQLGLTAVIPYSPLFYIAFDPLNWLVPDPNARLQAINLVCSALEASNVFFLFYTLKRAWGDGLAGLWAGALFVAFPLSNLLFSDGGYPGIFANWLLVLTIAALAWGYAHIGRPQVLIPFAILLGLALLAHTANAILLAPTLVLFALAVARWDRARLRGVVLWAGGGLALAFLSFYQFSAGHVVTDVLPQIVDKLRKNGGVGKGADHLGAPLLSGFGPQIEAHFRTWPVLLTVPAFLRAARPVSGAQVEHDPADRGLALWLGASAVTLGVFSVLDLWINLLQKHMIYFMPALALLSGWSLAALWRRGGAARWLCLALWAVLFAASLGVWVNRVVNYVLPPGSG
ncbi:MAG TPA: hypothetical protein VFM49_30535 [Chloroflexia bacterium]|nr:hypothetical protein [Chloroflexia bacterium]